MELAEGKGLKFSAVSSGAHHASPPGMSDIDARSILEDIQTLVFDKLQVVSYKWLCRNHSLSSNIAKRLLQEYVDKSDQEFKVVYALSGWLKSDPSTYHIRLVSGSILEDAKLEFEGNGSIQVYSVQAFLPEDPATLWNTEFLQSEELYKQPSTVINCLRDNRFGGIFDSSIQRNAEGVPVSILSNRPIGVYSPGIQDSNVVPKITTFVQQSKEQQPRAEGSAHSTKSVEKEKPKNKSTETHEHLKENEHFQLAKKGQNDTVNARNGGSLATMWGCASKKLKPTSSTEETTCSILASDVQTTENYVVEDGGIDDEGDHVNVKRSQKLGSHKRKLVIDSSDDEDDTETKVDDENDKQCGPVVQQEKATNNKIFSSNNVPESILENMKNHVPNKIVKTKDKETNPALAPSSPKRKKMVKTHIDGRGREVTEVVWEGQDEKKKSDERSTSQGTGGSSDTSTIKSWSPMSIHPNRTIGKNQKSPALESTAPSNQLGKAGSKKAGNSKDPKQGNIMSFFKRV
uniref:DNA polymerase delta subunit 3 n=1 Tax=Kalanchoe fedtschenkoi TaxID=63787 RepID=A0A7N0V6E2_KALFE